MLCVQLAGQRVGGYVSLALKRVSHRANLCTFDVLLLTASADILGEYYSTSTLLWGEIRLVEWWE